MNFNEKIIGEISVICVKHMNLGLFLKKKKEFLFIFYFWLLKKIKCKN